MKSKSMLGYIFTFMILASFYIEPRSLCGYGKFYDGVSCQDCGVSNVSSSFRIVGGRIAEQNSIPSQVYIKLSDGFCGGTLVSRRMVMTAAHCVRGASEVKIYLGVYNRNNLPAPITPSSIVIPAGYSSKTYINDLALILLPYSVTLSASIGVACLPQSSTTDPSPGTEVIASGWGGINTRGDTSDVLQYVRLPVVGTSSYYTDIDPSTQILAGYQQGGRDTCRGDSGGPLIRLENINGKTRQVVVGITSVGAGCGNPGIPGVYTRVSAFITWMENNLRYY